MGKFSHYGVHGNLIPWKGQMKTSLHSCGNQLSGCPCGCRAYVWKPAQVCFVCLGTACLSPPIVLGWHSHHGTKFGFFQSKTPQDALFDLMGSLLIHRDRVLRVQKGLLTTAFQYQMFLPLQRFFGTGREQVESIRQQGRTTNLRC